MQLLEQIAALRFPAPLPPTLLAVEQHFDAPCVDDIDAAVRHALADRGLLALVKPGETVAVTAGSRGIANLPAILRSAVSAVREAGASPFVIAAMGSHGGATAEGQIALLHDMGVTAETVGAEVRATMEVQPVGQLPDGPTLYQDVISAAADHTLLVNRVKPHTDFRGEVESGLAKMCVIGLGKQRGAAAMHAYGSAGFARFLRPAARIYEANSNILGGLAVVENANEETALIAALTPAEVGGPVEVRLQARAKELMASLPFPAIDVLVLRQIGKNISGTGLDTNVIGRLMIPRQPETFGGPDVAVIALLDITDASHGNATGMGLANVTTARFARKIDWVATYTNAVTSGIFGMWRVALPLVMADDRRALDVALRGCGVAPEAARLVFAEDTLHLGRLWVSPSLRGEVEAHPRLSIVGEVPLAFTAGGCMASPWELA